MNNLKISSIILCAIAYFFMGSCILNSSGNYCYLVAKESTIKARYVTTTDSLELLYEQKLLNTPKDYNVNYFRPYEKVRIIKYCEIDSNIVYIEGVIDLPPRFRSRETGYVLRSSIHNYPP
ncbi:MAG: hypothetical protein KDC55_12550 [Ignavibacteriae bacterium]|nr:hypothetical protein [Ignavibacteriota bacterium]